MHVLQLLHKAVDASEKRDELVLASLQTRFSAVLKGAASSRGTHFHHLSGGKTVLLQSGNIMLHGCDCREGVCSAGMLQALPPKHLRVTGQSGERIR